MVGVTLMGEGMCVPTPRNHSVRINEIVTNQKSLISLLVWIGLCKLHCLMIADMRMSDQHRASLSANLVQFAASP